MARAGRIVASCSLLLLVQACEDGGFTVPPSYHDVVVTANGLRTGYRTAGDPQWHFHSHDDVPELDCYDLAIAPNGALRYLSYVHRAESGDWRVSVRTGLGATEWASTFSSITVPAALPQPYDCARSRIEHLTGTLYGIFWLAEGEMHSALFDSSKAPGADLVVGEPFAHASFEENEDFERLSARSLSAVYFNDEVRVVWSPLERNRINMVSGALGPGGIDFDTASTFTAHEHEDMSDALAHDGALHVATADGERVRLWSRAGTVQWVETASCESDDRLPNRLLYADGNGGVQVLLGRGALLDFSDCSGTPFPLPVSSGVVSYFPGTS